MFEEMSDGGLFDNDLRFTKAEVADLIEARVRVAVEIAGAYPAHALLIKALDSNLGSDPFGSAFADEPRSFQKRARSQFFGLKKTLNEDEVRLARAYFAAHPLMLSEFEEQRIAVQFRDGRVVGYSIGSAA